MSLTSFLFVRCEFETKEIRDVAASYMTRGKRPYFEEDVPRELRKIFLALDELEYADVRKLSGSEIELSYDISDLDMWFSEEDAEEETARICKCLHSAGARSVFALINSKSDDCSEYMFYAFVSRKLKKVYIVSDIEEELENICAYDYDSTWIMQYFREKYQRETG